MEKRPIDVYQFVTKTELERTEPKNRFQSESADFDPILNTILDEVPELKDRYINAYNQYIGASYEPDPFPETFFEEVYKPILVTTSVIEEVQRLRTPKDTFPQTYNAEAIHLLVESMGVDVSQTPEIIPTLIQKAMQCIKLKEKEYLKCVTFDVRMLEIEKLQSNDAFKDLIPQMRVEAYQILNSLRPRRRIKKK